MKLTGLLTLALLAAAPFAAAPALANMCQADGATCPTGMPIDGYCECKSHGEMKSGTVVSGSQARQARHAARPDCRANPDATGCQHQ